MPNHYHLLLCLQTDNFSEAMQSLAQSYSNAINKRYHRVGTLFQGRFQAVHVDDDAYLLHLSRYIHLNPVAAKLTKMPEDWEFSSYQEYVGLRGGTLAQPKVVLSQFPSREAYRRFVLDGIAVQDKTISHLLFGEN